MAINTTYSEARANLAALCDRATIDRETVVITRRGSETVVLVAENEYLGLIETAHLLRSPKNARRLLSAVNRAKEGKGERQSINSLREEIGLGKK